MNWMRRCSFLALAVVLIHCGPEADSADTTADTSPPDIGTDLNVPDPGQDIANDIIIPPDQTVEVVSCADPNLAAPDTDTCAVIGDGSGLVLVGTVLRPSQVYENGAVSLEANGTISCVGCDCLASAGDKTIVYCPDAVISPGLINAHDHMGWMADRPWVADEHNVDPELRWEHRHDWRRAKRGNPKISTTGGASGEQKSWGELRFVLGGGTSINGSGSVAGLLRNLDRYEALEGLDGGSVHYETFPLDDASGTLKSSGCDYGDIDGPSNANAYTPHVSEGIDSEARNEFLCLTSSQNGGKETLKSNSSIIHGIGVLPIDVAQMSILGVRLIWSPRSNVSLYGNTAPVTMYHSQGIVIGLGTDWIPSGSMNMLRELACADRLNSDYYGGYFSDEALWRMVTVGAARTLHVEQQIGVLAEGKVADIAIFANGGRSHYRSVIEAGPQDVALVLRGGKVLSGDTALVAALESGCDSLDVCGVEKRVCLQTEIGKSLSQLQSSVGSMYPLFFCETPEDEPTCIPSRTLIEDAVANSNNYPVLEAQSDGDSDGIADDVDNCPAIFNPIRPVDSGIQGDFDGDGTGDACDLCPIDADTTDCTSFDPDDSDNDGIKDFSDNCPQSPNTDQLDGDTDGKGDACDLCPTVSNPGSAGCPYTVYEIQDVTAERHPPDGSQVETSCTVTVANVASLGYWCQDRAGGPYSGIFVYTGSEMSMVDDGNGYRPVAPGDDLTINASYVEYYDLSELTNPEVELESVGELLEPEVVSPAAIAAGDSYSESMEGVYIRIEAVSVIEVNADGDKDYDEFVVTGDLRVDDYALEGTTDGGLLDNTFPVGTHFTHITGACHYSFSNFKILPGALEDLYQGPPQVTGFYPPAVFQREGSFGATLPSAWQIHLNQVVNLPTKVALVSSNPEYAQVPSVVEIPAGSYWIDVPVSASRNGDHNVAITAVLGDSEISGIVSVLALNSPAKLADLSPASVQLMAGASVELHVSLDRPAPKSGTFVHFETVTNELGESFGVLVPFDLFIPYNHMAGSASFVAGSTAGAGPIYATVGDGPSLSLAASILDPNTTPLDISGWTLEQEEKTKTFVFPDGTTLLPGTYVVVGRKAAEDAFAEAWLGPNALFPDEVLYFNAADGFLVINSSAKSFLLKDADGNLVDGPTLDVGSNKTHQRLVPILEPELDESWESQTAGSPSPQSPATPGEGQPVVAQTSGVYISEVSDASGSGNYIYEFIELHYDGPAL